MIIGLDMRLSQYSNMKTNIFLRLRQFGSVYSLTPMKARWQTMKNKETGTESLTQADHFIDITEDLCPMTFVKTKLLLEKAENGDIVDVRLKGKEPLENVPRSALDHGHDVLSLSPEDESQNPDGIHRLRLRVVK